jgi:hypothetical protein
LLGSTDSLRTRCNNHINFQRDKLGRETGQPIRAIAGSILYDDVPSFDVAQIAKSLPHFFEATFRTKKADASRPVEPLCPRR